MKKTMSLITTGAVLALGAGLVFSPTTFAIDPCAVNAGVATIVPDTSGTGGPCEILATVSNLEFTGGLGDLHAALFAYKNNAAFGASYFDDAVLEATITDAAGISIGSLNSIVGDIPAGITSIVVTPGNGQITFDAYPTMFDSIYTIDYTNTIVHLTPGTDVVDLVDIYKNIGDPSVIVASGGTTVSDNVGGIAVNISGATQEDLLNAFLAIGDTNVIVSDNGSPATTVSDVDGFTYIHLPPATCTLEEAFATLQLLSGDGSVTVGCGMDFVIGDNPDGSVRIYFLDPTTTPEQALERIGQLGLVDAMVVVDGVDGFYIEVVDGVATVIYADEDVDGEEEIETPEAGIGGANPNWMMAAGGIVALVAALGVILIASKKRD